MEAASLNGGPPVRLPMIVPRGESLLMRAIRSSLYVARFERGWLGFVMRGVLDREQYSALGFIGELPQQLSLLTVLLDEGQSAVSDGARAGHGYVISRSASCRPEAA